MFYPLAHDSLDRTFRFLAVERDANVASGQSLQHERGGRGGAALGGRRAPRARGGAVETGRSRSHP